MESTGHGMRLRQFLKNKRILSGGVYVTAVWCLLALVLLFKAPGPVESVNNKMFDWKLSVAPGNDLAQNIVHLDVDDLAVRHVGQQWPWDRKVSALITQRLKDLGAKAVAFDIVYSQPGRTLEGDEAFLESVEKAGIVACATAFGQYRREGPEWGVDLDKNRADALYEKSWPVEVPTAFSLIDVSYLKNSFMPLLPLIVRARQVGHIKSTPDPDGVHRRVPLLVGFHDQCIPSLSLAALAVYWDLQPGDITLDAHRGLVIRHGSRTVVVPVDRKARILVKWTRPEGKYKHFSAADLLTPEWKDPAMVARYKDKVVIVAAYFTGSTDHGTTPMGPEQALSRIHSNTLSNILSQDFVVGVSPWPWIVAVAVVTSLVFAVLVANLRLETTILVLLGIFGAAVALSLGGFFLWSYEIPLAEALAILGPAAFGTLTLKTLSMELIAGRTSRALECYLSPEILNRILISGSEIDLSTRRKELSILFADIEGFSTICETVEIEYLNRFLNEFFELMTQAVFRYHGTVDKFLGDGLLAFFGDPVPLENHAMAAVRAGIEMQGAMRKLSTEWAQKGVKEFERGPRLRVGVSTGIVIVGNIGSRRRMEYTVLGSEINVASRIQRIAPPGEIFITSRTRALTKGDINSEGPEGVRVKGIDRPIDVYRVIQPKSDGEQ